MSSKFTGQSLHWAQNTMEPQIPKPPQAPQPQRSNGPSELKKEYLRTMQKDIAQMEQKKAEMERSEILKRGFVAPQAKGVPQAPPSPQVRRPFPMPSPPLKPQEPKLKMPLTAPSPPPIISPGPIPPSIIKPMGLPPKQPPPPPPLRPFIPQRKEPTGVPGAPQTPQGAISKFTLPPKKKKSPAAKIIPGIVLVLIIGGGASGYWFFIRKETLKLPCLPIICRRAQAPPPPLEPPIPQPPETSQPASQKERSTPPVSIIRVDKQMVYEINGVEKVKNIIAENLKQPGPLHSLESMDFFWQNQRFLSFDEVTKALGVSIPNTLINTLGDQYTLFRFWQKEGWRVGFVAQIKDVTTLKQQATLWEKTVVADSEDFFDLLGKQSNKGPFKTANWQGVLFRYFDFLPEKLGIVYAIHPTQNVFVFTSSGDSMIDLINRIELK